LSNYFESTVENWKSLWNNPYQKRRFIIGTLLWLIVIFLLPYFFDYIEKRKGTTINDQLLALIPAYNVSIYIFSIIWGTILLIVVRAINNPSIYIVYCWTFIFICVARASTIGLIPLNPPIGYIPLADPLTGVFYGNHVISKDLFFSGHVSTIFLIFLCLKKRSDKILALIATFCVAGLLLVQHVHYTIDVIAAPFFVYALYWITRRFIYRRAVRKKRRRRPVAQ
jgi:hypothetical protein